MKYLQTFLLIAIFATAIVACSKTQNKNTDTLTGTWQLTEYSGNGMPWQPVSIGWPKGIVNNIEFRNDSTFTKTIIFDSKTNVESGRYSVGIFDGKKYISLNYTNKNVQTNKVIQSCANSEGFFWISRDTIANVFWSMCDGPDLKFSRKK